MVAELVDEEQAERIACHHGVGIEGEFADGVEGLATRLQEELDAARLRARVVHDFHHADIEEMTTGFALLGLQANEAVHDLFGTRQYDWTVLSTVRRYRDTSECRGPADRGTHCRYKALLATGQTARWAGQQPARRADRLPD